MDNEKITDQIEGRNSVLEYLKSDRDINKILIAKGERHGSINEIIARAKERKIVIAEVERQKLNAISNRYNRFNILSKQISLFTISSHKLINSNFLSLKQKKLFII